MYHTRRVRDYKYQSLPTEVERGYVTVVVGTQLELVHAWYMELAPKPSVADLYSSLKYLQRTGEYLGSYKGLRRLNGITAYWTKSLVNEGNRRGSLLC
jgi:hypothetical protein